MLSRDMSGTQTVSAVQTESSTEMSLLSSVWGRPLVLGVVWLLGESVAWAVFEESLVNYDMLEHFLAHMFE